MSLCYSGHMFASGSGRASYRALASVAGRPAVEPDRNTRAGDEMDGPTGDIEGDQPGAGLVQAVFQASGLVVVEQYL